MTSEYGMDLPVGWACKDWDAASIDEQIHLSKFLHRRKVSEALRESAQHAFNHRGKDAGPRFKETDKNYGALWAFYKLGVWCYFAAEQEKRIEAGKEGNPQWHRKMKQLYDKFLPQYVKWREGDSIWPRKVGENLDYWTSSQIFSLQQKCEVIDGEKVSDSQGYQVGTSMGPGPCERMFFGEGVDYCYVSFNPVASYLSARVHMFRAVRARDEEDHAEGVAQVMRAIDRLKYQNTTWNFLSEKQYHGMYKGRDVDWRKPHAVQQFVNALCGAPGLIGRASDLPTAEAMFG